MECHRGPQSLGRRMISLVEWLLYFKLAWLNVYGNVYVNYRVLRDLFGSFFMSNVGGPVFYSLARVYKNVIVLGVRLIHGNRVVTLGAFLNFRI